MLVLILAGGYFLRQNYSEPSRPQAATVAPSGSVPASQQGSAGWNTGGDGGTGGNGSSEFRTSIQSALEDRLRPAGLIETLYGNQKLDWLKISAIDLPTGGKPKIVFAVLYARLDDETEKRWRDVGLLKNEGIVATPFVRKITISDRDNLDLLLDWHVEGVVDSLPIKPVK